MWTNSLDFADHRLIWIFSIMAAEILVLLLALPCMQRLRAAITELLQLPDALCPHCENAVCDAIEKFIHWGRRWYPWSFCPHCGQKMRIARAFWMFTSFPFLFIGLLVYANVPWLPLRIIIPLVSVAASRYIFLRFRPLTGPSPGTTRPRV